MLLGFFFELFYLRFWVDVVLIRKINKNEMNFRIIYLSMVNKRKFDCVLMSYKQL
jgi:hypothetical protein